MIAGNAADTALSGRAMTINSPNVTRLISFDSLVSANDRSQDIKVRLKPVSGLVTETQHVVFGSTGNDSIYGDSVATPLAGVNTPNELLFGGAGDDMLLGGSEWDVVLSGAGDDMLVAGAGLDSHDSLYGGAGYDTHAFNFGATQNGIWDSDGKGRIEYNGFTLTGANGKLATALGGYQYASFRV